MNLFYNQAKNLIKQEAGEGFGIVNESIQDLTDFYGFTYQSEKFLETGRFEDMSIGQGYNFINKLDNRVYTFSSGIGFEEALKELRKKISQEAEIKKFISEFDIQKKFDIRVLSVMKKQILVDTLMKNGMSYIIPEVVGGSIFRIEKKYRKKFLFEKLTNLPITFHGLNQNELPELIIELTKNSLCEFELFEHIDTNLAKYVDKVTNIDLDPIW